MRLHGILAVAVAVAGLMSNSCTKLKKRYFPYLTAVVKRPKIGQTDSSKSTIQRTREPMEKIFLPTSVDKPS